MANVVFPHTFVPNTSAKASEVNDNFTAVTNQVNGNLDATNLANNAVTEPKILDSAVTTSKINNNAVTTAKIGDTQVTNAKIASGVDAAKLTTGTLPIARIADGAISTAKIGDAQVTTAKIGDSQVTTAKIGDAQVTTAKIGDTQVTNAKIASGVDAAKLTTGTLPIGRIADSAVTNAKLASDIDAAKLTTGTLPIARIDNGAVTNAKLADVATNTIKGRVAVGSGVPTDLTAANVRAIINVADGANNYVHPNHSGDVTSVGDGATTIAAGAVTNAKLADVSTNTIKGRIAVGSGAPTDLTAANVRTLLNVADGANDYVHPNHSGDVTSVGDGATTISNDAVSNAKLANMAVNRIKGRIDAGTGDPQDLTAADVRAILNVTSTNTNNAIVARDASGNFAANAITAAANSSFNGIIVGRSANNNAFSTAVGASALAAASTGVFNTAVGANTLSILTIGGVNTGVGADALKTLTTGNFNTAVGGQAMENCGTGAAANTVVGAQSGTNLTGVDNTFIGKTVALFATSADRNTAIGANALFELTTGNNNIAIGQNSGTTSINVAPPTGLQNITTQSNKIIMGNFLHNEAFIKIAWTVTSDKRDKTEFKPIKHGLDFVTKLKPTEYQFKLDNRDGDGDGIRRYGFNAQDILKLEGTNPVIINASNPEHLTYNESHLVPVLVQAIQELKKELDELKAGCACSNKELV